MTGRSKLWTWGRLICMGCALTAWAWAACDAPEPGHGDGPAPDAQASSTDGLPEPRPEPLSEPRHEPRPEPVKELPQDPVGPNGKLRLPAKPFAPKRYSGKSCPAFKAGENTITSAFLERGFQLFLPPEPKGAPLLFVWHPLGGNADQIANAFGAAALSKQYGAVVVVPHSCCSGPVKLDCCSRATEWSYVGDTEPDLVFFDDLLACVDRQYDIDNRRVMTTGFSAGSLWSSFLVVYRSEYLASAVIFSGGVGVFDYATPLYPVPVILAWGGTRDTVGGIVDFDRMTRSLIDQLKKDDHFVIACNHGLGHSIPQGAGSWAFPFLFAHTFGDGKSDYSTTERQKGFPSYCMFPN